MTFHYADWLKFLNDNYTTEMKGSQTDEFHHKENLLVNLIRTLQSNYKLAL